jgi:catechol 2,3-dioxygenase-like lactoylglutathione lyase family enzyme
MRLRFWYQPVGDLETAAAFYRDTLGLEEAWREGSTMAFGLPGSDAKLMIDEDPAENGAGLFFVVPNVAEFYESNRGRMAFLEEPRSIGPGMLVRFTDPAGNVIRLMDDTTSEERGRPVR